MELRHHTTQHSGDEPAQEDVSCLSLLSTSKTIQACVRLRAKWTYLSHLKHSSWLQSGNKAMKQGTSRWRP